MYEVGKARNDGALHVMNMQPLPPWMTRGLLSRVGEAPKVHTTNTLIIAICLFTTSIDYY